MNTTLGCIACVLLLALPALASSRSEDDCKENTSKELFTAETVALMHIDIRHHEIVCQRDESDSSRKRALVATERIYRERSKLIRKAQDTVVEYLGGEKKFNTYYVNSANQISFLFIPKPCQRLLHLAEAVLSSTVEDGRDLHHVYLPFFIQLENDFNTKYKDLKFQRLCRAR